MNKLSFYNKDRNNSTLQTLSQALANRDKSEINTGTVPQYRKSSNDDISGGASSFLNNGLKLGKTLFENYGNSGSGNTDLSAVGNAANNFVNDVPDYGTVGNAINSEVMGTAGTGSAVGDAIGAEAGGSFLGNVAPYGGIIMGGLRAGMNGLNGGDWKDDVPQSFFGINPEGSDTSQALNGAMQGAIMGMPFGGPIGAAIGAALGLGASFLDDI